MKFKKYIKYSDLAVAGMVMVTFSLVHEMTCSPYPDQRGGGSRRGKGGGYEKYDEKAFQEAIKTGYESKSSSKIFAKKTWENALSFKPGANISDQTSKEMKDTLSSNEYLGKKLTFDEWKDYVEKDGWLCRDDKDCIWYDLSLGCNDRQFNISNVKADWPWKKDLRGRCACQYGFWFDHESDKCEEVKMNWIFTLLIIGCILGSCVFCSCICHIILRITRKLEMGQSD